MHEYIKKWRVICNKMRTSLLLLTSLSVCNGIYDKYTNRDIYGLMLRMNDIPFYSSSELYSSHYSKSLYNITKNTSK